MTTRTTLAPTVLAANGTITTTKNDGTGFTATDNTNGMTVAISTTAVPAGGAIDRILFLVLNTGTGGTVTIRGATSDGGVSKAGAGAGNGPAFTYPAFEGGKGDVVSGTITTTTGIGILGPFEVARFMQPDGTVSLDFSGNLGFIKALLLPRAF